MLFNAYADESCHLLNDHQRAMVLGVVWFPREKSEAVRVRLREIKEAHGVPGRLEVKWGRICPANVALYLSMIDYFFEEPDLRFRAVVVPDKHQLDHARFGQSHDDWYYKMYYLLFKKLMTQSDRFRIFLDIKDTRSEHKILHLRDVLCSSRHDFTGTSVSLQSVRSDEVQAIQLADVLIGAVSYVARGLDTSEAKVAVVERIRARSGHRLLSSTPVAERKFDVFYWRAR